MQVLWFNPQPATKYHTAGWGEEASFAGHKIVWVGRDHQAQLLGEWPMQGLNPPCLCYLHHALTN